MNKTEWFCYERHFNGRAVPVKYTKRPEPKHAEGADRRIIEGSLMEIPVGLSLDEAEKYFLLKKGGRFEYRA